MPPDQVYGLMATGPDNEKPGAVGGNEGRKVSEVNVGHMIPAYQTVTVSGLHPMRLFEKRDEIRYRDDTIQASARTADRNNFPDRTRLSMRPLLKA